MLGRSVRLARDGEVGEPVDHVSVRVHPGALVVYRGASTGTDPGD
jgi:hypothetical protein